MKTSILIAVEQNQSIDEHLLVLLSSFCGFAIRAVTVSEQGVTDCDVFYGDSHPDEDSLQIPVQGPWDKNTIPAPVIDNINLQQNIFPFDLFSAMRYWLCNEAAASYSDDDYDPHDRLIEDRSVQAQRDFFHIPVVNSYMIAFRDWILAHFELDTNPLLPASKGAIILSHDVDDPVSPGDLINPLSLIYYSLRYAELRPYLKSHLKYLLYNSLRFIKYPFQKLWTFEKVVEEEAKRGFKSAFMFSSATFGYPETSHVHEVHYSVFSAPMQKLFRNLRQKGWEIGLHAGYGARESTGAIGQMEGLELACGEVVRFNRHH